MILARVQASELRVGDRCRGSRALIVAPPSRGARTPAGKVDLTVTYPGDPATRHRRTWGARTMIGIERPDLTGELTHPDAEQHPPVTSDGIGRMVS